jgi:hypothetical protein
VWYVTPQDSLPSVSVSCPIRDVPERYRVVMAAAHLPLLLLLLVVVFRSAAKCHMQSIYSAVSNMI